MLKGKAKLEYPAEQEVAVQVAATLLSKVAFKKTNPG